MHKLFCLLVLAMTLMTSAQKVLAQNWGIDDIADSVGLNQFAANTAPNGTFSAFADPSIITNANGSVDLVLQFNYAQSTAIASNFLVFYNASGAASQLTDAAYSIDARPGTATYTVRILGINPTPNYSYAVAAYMITK